MKKHVNKRNLRTSIGLHTLLTALSVLWMLPVFWLLLSSFRKEPGAYTPYLWPKGFTFDNYTRLFTDTRLFNFPRWFMNTLFVAICCCVLTTILTLMVAYVYSRLRFKSRKAIMNISLILGMFPGFMSMIAIYHFMKAIGLDQTLLALILVYSGGAALNYYIAKGFFDTIPKSLDEAARVDGATRAQVLFRIILPLAKPIVIYTVLTAFMAPWGDFIFAKYITNPDSSQAWNVAVGLQNWLSTTTLISEKYTMFCTGGVVVAIPVVILFMCLQRYYVEGVTGGAVKG